jgi:L-2-hydroxyglutarate oxidase LhgO
MNTCDLVVIGGGVVGLTIAREWLLRYPKSDVVVLEKEQNSVAHGSGRNSGVVHSGIYYTEGSLRAQLCVSGCQLMRDYVSERGLWIDHCGKLLVPPSESALGSMQILLNRGRANGVEIHQLTGKEALELEPHVNPQFDQALFVPITSVVNPKEVVERIKKDVIDTGGVIHYNASAGSIDSKCGTVQTSVGTFESPTVVNAAGLFADQVAKRAGLKTRYSFQPFKGKYWKHKNTHFKMRRLVYPVPDLDLPFLGVHTAHNSHGEVYFGPSSTPVIGRENYEGFKGISWLDGLNLSASLVKKFFCNTNGLRALALREMRLIGLEGVSNELSKIVSGIGPDDLERSLAKVGIRSQIFDTDSQHLVNDFIVVQDDKTIHILNAISPAFTASFAFARYVLDQQK